MVNVTASVLNELQVEETANGESIEEPTDQADDSQEEHRSSPVVPSRKKAKRRR